jgi:hypothetical protein
MLEPFKLNDKNEQEKPMNSANPKYKSVYQTPPKFFLEILIFD